MSDFPDEEPDPEMTEDHEENAPGLEEALEEIFRVPQILPALLVKKVENVVPFAHSRLALQKRSKRETNAANAKSRFAVHCQKYCCVCIQDLPFHEF